MLRGAPLIHAGERRTAHVGNGRIQHQGKDERVMPVLKRRRKEQENEAVVSRLQTTAQDAAQGQRNRSRRILPHSMATEREHHHEKDCEINFSNFQNGSKTFIDIKSGKLILVNASELIQSLAYPDLEMETLLEIDNLDTSTYSIKFEGINSIELKKSSFESEMNNVIELL